MREKADFIRQEIIRVCPRNKAGHIAPSLSCVDILTSLYYRVMRCRPKEPLWEERDRLVFSKGHGCYGLYAILADIGVIPKAEGENFYNSKSSLSGCCLSAGRGMAWKPDAVHWATACHWLPA